MRRVAAADQIVQGAEPIIRISSSRATPVAATQAVVTQIVGRVTDTAFRQLPGVSVEVTNGPAAGTLAMSGPYGAFTLSGQFTGVLTIRATKDGFLSATETLDLSLIHI